MNAEFLEQKIVFTEVEEEIVITPAKVRKGLDAKAFVGAMVCADAGCELITAATESDGTVTITLTTAINGELTYAAATGEFTFTPANNETEQTADPGTGSDPEQTAEPGGESGGGVTPDPDPGTGSGT